MKINRLRLKLISDNLFHVLLNISQNAGISIGLLNDCLDHTHTCVCVCGYDMLCTNLNLVERCSFNSFEKPTLVNFCLNVLSGGFLLTNKLGFELCICRHK